MSSTVTLTLEAVEGEGVWDEIKLEDMEYDEDEDAYYYDCPCGDRFCITKAELEAGERIAVCPSCSLQIRVLLKQA